MRKDFTGLSRYNPLCISRGDNLINEFYAEITLFLAKSPETLFHFNIPKLLEERKTVVNVYMLATKQTGMQVYTTKFNELLNNLLALIGTQEEIFWDNMFVLEQIFLKDSIIKECRALITNNLQKISTILSEAQKREKNLKKEDINSLSKYAIMSFYITNKFKPESDLNDDTLFEFLLDKFFDKQKFNMELFTILSMYKNCDKFDLSWQDVVNEFQDMNSCAVDYSWIFIPYLQRYRKKLEDCILNAVGDDIYDFWFSYLLSKEYVQDTIEYTDSAVKQECREAIDAFKECGVYAYEYNKLFRQIMKERQRYG